MFEKIHITNIQHTRDLLAKSLNLDTRFFYRFITYEYPNFKNTLMWVRCFTVLPVLTLFRYLGLQKPCHSVFPTSSDNREPRSSGQYDKSDELKTRSSEVGGTGTHRQSFCKGVILQTVALYVYIGQVTQIIYRTKSRPKYSQ